VEAVLVLNADLGLHRVVRPRPVRGDQMALHHRSGLVPVRGARPRRPALRLLPGQATTVDHVLPRSRSGRNTWTNTVASRDRCNQRKGDRTPAEAGMVLKIKSTVPSWASLHLR
jgi:5-methylcytosine-specific restriction endonuclease McrA